MICYRLASFKSFKLAVKFIDIQRDTLTFTNLTLVEPALKKFPCYYMALEYGTPVPSHIKVASTVHAFKRHN